MGRRSANARSRGIRPLGDARARKILTPSLDDHFGDPAQRVAFLIDTDSEFEPEYRSMARPQRPAGPATSRTIAQEAKSRIKQVDNVPKPVKNLAAMVTGFWSSPTAPVVACRSMEEPGFSALTAMMRDRVSVTGSTIIAVGAVRDLINGKPLDGDIGAPYSPARQAALRLAETSLLEACGSEDVFRAFEAPIPEGIRIGFSDGQGGYRYSYDVKPAEPLDVRLASYDRPTVLGYVESLGNRTLERHSVGY